MHGVTGLEQPATGRIPSIPAWLLIRRAISGSRCALQDLLLRIFLKRLFDAFTHVVGCDDLRNRIRILDEGRIVEIPPDFQVSGLRAFCAAF